ncbi:MAG: peptide deformylase [Candidatus Portnoybacteria bacterium RBG_13_41_18]|uniref:Peptide deformylase n=1 Tax=Candidatus Portnoybacteria bacterium RBG_13_41_18 TaxID=1801991 RepID=A0A1G2FAZ2_9BACT|nr:MAG: peptide deformylase [Candidatus Portnoybacteria bacterium RBG_13_41_18]
MIREIKTYPDKVLKQKAKRVGVIDAEIKKLIGDMVETMLTKDGAGLAANQLGELKQVIAVNTVKSALVLINPKIIKRDGRVVATEGCLSLPGFELEVRRPQKIVVEYLDKSGKGQKLKASDLLARVICHEADHLQGKTLLDKLPLFKRWAIKRKLKKATK